MIKKLIDCIVEKENLYNTIQTHNFVRRVETGPLPSASQHKPIASTCHKKRKENKLRQGYSRCVEGGGGVGESIAKAILSWAFIKIFNLLYD